MVPRLGYGVDGSSPETRIPEQLPIETAQMYTHCTQKAMSDNLHFIIRLSSFLRCFLRDGHKLRYDTRRCFNMHSKADICQLNLPYGSYKKYLQAIIN